MRAAIKVVKVKRPVSGKVIGERLVCAHINRKQYDIFSGEMIQSFAPCHRIAETGDYYTVGKKAVERFIRLLKEWHKIDKVEWY